MDFIKIATQRKNSPLLYAATIVLVFIAIQLSIIPLFAAAYFHLDGDLNAVLAGASSSFMNIGMSKNLLLFLIIFGFVLGVGALYLCVKYIHKGKFKDIITAREKVDWKRFFFAFGLVAVVFSAVMLLDVYLSPQDYTWNFKPVPFCILLVVLLLFLPFQTGFEELVFRGYLMQALALVFKNRGIALILTSVLFGLMHFANPEVDKLGSLILINYIGSGFLLGMLTLLDEGTELSLGFHTANNFVAAFLITTDWMVFQTDAIFVNTVEPKLGLQVFVPVFCLYPLLLVVFAKKYKWKNWKQKLFGKC